MQISDKELRKMLNKAWDKGVYIKRRPVFKWLGKVHTDQRYRDVSKILKEAVAVDWTKINTPNNEEEKP